MAGLARAIALIDIKLWRRPRRSSPFGVCPVGPSA
jgi:hypothetical protein